MPEHLFGISLSTYPVPQKTVMETGHPLPSVPVYCIHSFEQPFCQNTTCRCHTHQQEVVRWFVSIIEGRVELGPAAALLETGGKEPHA